MKKFLLFICSSKFLFLLSSILLVTIIVLDEHYSVRYAEFKEAYYSEKPFNAVALGVDAASVKEGNDMVGGTEPLSGFSESEHEYYSQLMMMSSKSSISSWNGWIAATIYLTFIISGLITLISFLKKRFFPEKKKATTSGNQ